jgi:hypothetical protein
MKKLKPGIGVSTAVVDRAFWLDDGRGGVEGREWIEALEAIDVHGDKSRLLELLQSDMPLPHSSRRYLADLIARYELKRPRGGRATPAYDRSGSEAMLLLAKDAYHDERRRKGKTVEEAIAAVAQQFDLAPNVVRTAVEGRRGSSRRSKR